VPVAQPERRLQDIAAAGVGILIVEQNAAFALSIASRSYVLEKGKVKVAGTVEEIRNQPDFTALLTV
jgi:branched-chain amino acid transport system ATP-binding protein